MREDESRQAGGRHGCGAIAERRCRVCKRRPGLLHRVSPAEAGCYSAGTPSGYGRTLLCYAQPLVVPQLAHL
jgi:hypothetical protein